MSMSSKLDVTNSQLDSCVIPGVDLHLEQAKVAHKIPRRFLNMRT